MKLALDHQSASSLRELADALPKAVVNITESTTRLIQTYQSVSENLGPHREQFYQMLLHIRKAQQDAAQALQELPPAMRTTAEKIEAYLAKNTDSSAETVPQKILSGSSFGTDGAEHDYQTVVRFSEKPEGLPSPTGFGISQTQAREWGHAHYTSWMDSLSEQEQTAVIAYSGPGYGELNRKMRAGESLSPAENELQTNLHAALSKASLPEDVTVYRALSENAVRELALYCSQGCIEEGISIQDSAFMSCSLVSDCRFNRMSSNVFILRMAAPAGVHAAYIGGLSLFESEQELLADGGHSIYVTGVTECLRSDVTGHPEDNDKIVLIDGVLTV